MTNKQEKRGNELLHKVLVDKKSLDESELKELKNILDALEKEREKKKGKLESYDEIVDGTLMISLCAQAIDGSRKISFDQLSIEEKAKNIQERLEEFENSSCYKKLSKEQKDKQAKEDFENFYEEYAKKHGRTL